MNRGLNDDDIVNLLNGDVSDIEEFDEGEDINYENLDEILSTIPNESEVNNNVELTINENLNEVIPNNLDLLEQILNNNEIEDFELFETIQIPKWEKVPWNNTDNIWKGSLPKPPDNILSPFEYFKLFVDNDMICNISEQTNLYSVEKCGKCVATSPEEIEQFLGIQLYMSIIKMPSYRMFWSENTRFTTISDAMSRNRFDSLRSNIHFNDNSKMLPREHPNHDKLFKVRPFINAIRENMKKIKVEEYTAVDEIIIPFKGRSTMKQYNKNKPHKWGIKMFALASSNGLVHDFEIYVGKGTLPPSEHGLGISGDVVMRLVDSIPKHQNYKVSMDNWFNSHSLQCKLHFCGILGIGTVRSNRIAGCVLESDKTLKSKGRGTHDSQVDTVNNIVVTKWFDNKVVHVISNYQGPLPINQVKRWSVTDKKYINIPRPTSIAEYNSFMGGVDLYDMLVEIYRVNIRQLKIKKTMSLLKFKSEVAHALLQAGKNKLNKRGRPSLSTTPPTKKRRLFAPRPVDNVRFDEIAHWPIPVTKKQR
ncbi:hypothetical protein AGLY_017448, partial [Aphis glycines]